MAFWQRFKKCSVRCLTRCFPCCFKNDDSPARIDILPIPETNVRVMAVFDFAKRYPDDLAFVRGDRLVVIDMSDDDWWRARHSTTGEVGTIPSNFVRRLEPKPENHEAWYHVVRREACFLLSNVGPGTFLLRPYAHEDAHCTLSVCATDPSGTALIYKHFKVLVDPDGVYRFCHKSSNRDFFQLIEDHKEPVRCDCGTVLTTHCKTVALPPVLLIPRDSIRIDYCLGGGYFGEVWHGFLNTQPVAVKMLKTDRVATPNIVQDFLGEAQKMSNIKHPNVVQLLGVCMDDGPILIVMEFLARGSLLQYLRDDAGKYVTSGRIFNMLASICDGMDYVSTTLNLVHRDLRAANILVSENLTVKIADFGLARDSEYSPTTFQLPIRWTAPEAFSAEGNSIKADVWSFGILTYEVITYGWVPYAEMSKEEVKTAVAAGYRLPNPNGHKILGGNRSIDCPDSVYSQILDCWHTDPQQRPTFAFLRTFFNDSAGLADSEYLNADEVN